MKTFNFTIIDFGSVIEARSVGDKRIKGDARAHYGLEARLLFAQQFLHELIALEVRKLLV